MPQVTFIQGTGNLFSSHELYSSLRLRNNITTYRRKVLSNKVQTVLVWEKILFNGIATLYVEHNKHIYLCPQFFYPFATL